MSLLTATVVGGTSILAGLPRAVHAQEKRVVKKGRIKHSICGGCLRKLRLSKELEAAQASKMGIVGLDLVGRKDWDTVKKHGLVATMVSGAGGIRKGLNDKLQHAKFLEDFRKNIRAAAEYKWPNVITMAGDRKGIGDEEGMDNCYKRIGPLTQSADSEFDSSIVEDIVKDYKDHPALFAYGVRDEPGADLLPRIEKICRLIRKLDPVHEPLINLFPGHATPKQLGMASYRDYVRRCIEMADAPVVAIC